jgi:arginine decarboxylase-like protein
MVLAIIVAVEMDKRQLTNKHVVVIKQVVAINNRNSSACSTLFTSMSRSSELLNPLFELYREKKRTTSDEVVTN